MVAPTYHCTWCGPQSLRSGRRLSEFECAASAGDGFTIADIDLFVMCGNPKCKEKSTYECLRRLQSAAFAVMKNLGVSLKDVHDPHGVWRVLINGDFDAGIASDAFLPKTDSKYATFRHRCPRCEDACLPAASDLRQSEEMRAAAPDLDPAVHLLPWVSVLTVVPDVQQRMMLTPVEQIEAYPVIPNALQEKTFQADIGTREAVGGARAASRVASPLPHLAAPRRTSPRHHTLSCLPSSGVLVAGAALTLSPTRHSLPLPPWCVVLCGVCGRRGGVLGHRAPGPGRGGARRALRRAAAPPAILVARPLASHRRASRDARTRARTARGTRTE